MDTTHQTLSLPVEAYYIAGALLISNLSTLASILYTGFKIVWWASKLDSRVDEAKSTAVWAHKRLDKMKHVQKDEVEPGANA